MPISINCQYAEDGIYCTNKNVKRSLFGLGARMCMEAYRCDKCPYKVKNPRPDPPTGYTPPPKIDNPAKVKHEE